MIRTNRLLWLSAVLMQPLAAEGGGLLAHWSFDDPGDHKAITVDRVSGRGDPVTGSFRFMPGVTGGALRFDGYTTVVERAADAAPKPGDGFTLDCWVALAAYPWNHCPIISQADVDKKLGYRLMAGTRGELILEVAAGGKWYSLASGDQVIPLRQWTHVAGSYDSGKGLAIHINGRPAGTLAASGPLNPASHAGLRIGSLHEPAKPAHIHREWGTLATWWTLDGQLDELRIHERALENDEIARAFEATGKIPAPEMPPRRMPAGPPGPGRFGATYTRLKYHEQWDDLWRVGDDPDVLVRFDRSPVRLVFWRGTRFSPAWVSENDLWMADQSVEAWDHDETNAEGCYEHMQDRHCLYSHVRVIESNPARVVVHWRYAPVSAHNHLWRPDPRTGMACWVDEYYTIYPDATAVRKPTWTTGTLGHPRQFQESLPLTHPGQYTYDVVNNPYCHVANLAGETDTCDFAGKDGKGGRKKWPDHLILQRYNFKSAHKPFIIFEEGNRMQCRQEGTYAPERPAGCNHWPVGQAACDGRTIQAADRPSHSMGFPISNPVVHESDGRSWWAGLYGMGTQSVEDLLEIAKAFNHPPELTLDGAEYESAGFDRGQRAWVVTNRGVPGRALRMRLAADQNHPLHNPAVVIRNAGDAPVRIHIDGKPVKPGTNCRIGYRHHPDTSDLILWIEHAGTRALEIGIEPDA
jgi:hypothetical protein